MMVASNLQFPGMIQPLLDVRSLHCALMSRWPLHGQIVFIEAHNSGTMNKCRVLWFDLHVIKCDEHLFNNGGSVENVLDLTMLWATRLQNQLELSKQTRKRIRINKILFILNRFLVHL